MMNAVVFEISRIKKKYIGLVGAQYPSELELPVKQSVQVSLIFSIFSGVFMSVFKMCSTFAYC